VGALLRWSATSAFHMRLGHAIAMFAVVVTLLMILGVLLAT
jgi:hypothetical protein